LQLLLIFPSPFGVVEFELLSFVYFLELSLLFPSPFGVVEFEPVSREACN